MNTLARQVRADVAGERLDLGEEVLGVASREFEDVVLGAELAQLLHLGRDVVGRALKHVTGVGGYWAGGRPQPGTARSPAGQ